MFHQARRIGELSSRGGDFAEMATLQCHSYLAATNALSLVENKHAWIAVATGEESNNRVSTRQCVIRLTERYLMPSVYYIES
jgi:nuclear pore complex protein Nup160